MAAPPVVYEWLERLEDHLAAGGPTDLDAFVRDNLPDAPPKLLAEFRGKAQAVIRFHGRVGPAVLAPTSGQIADETDAPAANIAPGEEPLPGYRLEVEIGRGGYGRVWRATAPGGRAVAVKVVELDRGAAWAEVRSVRLLCAVRHPNLIAYHRAATAGRHLVIVMDLADRTAADRLAEARSAGQPGIPRDELMGYMAGAAAGLDYLNSGETGRRIQHRDVKPGNLLLVGRELRVADFGLARVLEHTVSTHTGGHTPQYAAPEVLRNRVTAWTDQYSLAVAYCQLRGGRLPYAGPPAAVLHGHLHDEPDLTMLPPAERPVVRRALAKTPHHRWRSCGAFVAALRDGPDPAAVKKELVADLDNVTLRKLYLAVRTEAQARSDRSGRVRPGLVRTLLPVTARLVLGTAGLLPVWYFAFDPPPEQESVVKWFRWGLPAVLVLGWLVCYREIRALLRLRERLRGMVAELGPLPPLPLGTPPDEIRGRFLGPDRDVSGFTAGGAAPARTL